MISVKSDLTGKTFGRLIVIRQVDDAVKSRKQAEEKYFGEWSYDNSISCRI